MNAKQQKDKIEVIMKNTTIIAIILIITATSCATQYIVSHKNHYKKYRNELVSVETALSLARNSYTLACVKAKKEQNPQKHYFKTCQKLASQYIKESVEFILTQ